MHRTARVKNIGASAVQIAWLGAAGRGPDVPDWDCGKLDWDNCGADFEALENVTIQPGEEVAYYQPRLPAIRGGYWAEMVFQDAATGNWSGPVNANRVSYRVSGGEIAVVQ